jgi:hypothetical protein
VVKKKRQSFTLILFGTKQKIKIRIMTKDRNVELREKIKKGLDLAYKKMIKAKQLIDGEIAVSENGIIKRIKARDIKV